MGREWGPSAALDVEQRRRLRGSSELWPEGEQPALSQAGTVGGPEHETPGYSVRHPEPTQCPECPGWRREGWRGIRGPVCLSWQGTWQMPRSGPGLGPRGLRALAVPVLVHKGPLTCTGPECGPHWGPACVQEQVLLGHRLPAGLCSPSSLWPWWQLVSWDGGGCGFACGLALSSRSLGPTARKGHSPLG